MALNPTYDSTYNYNTPQIEEKIPTTNIDLTDKKNFDIRKLEGLGIGYTRRK
jgi:hypothetical protein